MQRRGPTSRSIRERTTNETHEEPAGKDYVLVVEDDPLIISRLLTLELGAEGYEVRRPAMGSRRWRWRWSVPDLVLCDVMMPRMDGFELTRRLRDDPRTEATTIIVITARGLGADKLEGLSSGADDYIVKPFDNEEVIARVRGAIRRSKRMKSRVHY